MYKIIVIDSRYTYMFYNLNGSNKLNIYPPIIMSNPFLKTFQLSNQYLI